MQVFLELAGLEPATSWVRSTLATCSETAWLASAAHAPGRPNIFPNMLQSVRD
jgi:hypothetical protein